jgi:NAD(P)H-hydrate epimerase
VAALDRFRAVAVGPGLGAGDRVQELVRDLLARAAAPVVLDADGLNALAGDLAPLEARRADGRVTVLTPHDAEFARIAGAPVGNDRIAAARALAARSGAFVLLKGPGTVVAEPGGRAAINPTGSEALASAGTGDVLTGIVAAFLARGTPPFEATAAAAWVHGAAADAVRDFTGPTGLVASDLVVAIAPTLLALNET